MAPSVLRSSVSSHASRATSWSSDGAGVVEVHQCLAVDVRGDVVLGDRAGAGAGNRGKLPNGAAERDRIRDVVVGRVEQHAAGAAGRAVALRVLLPGEDLDRVADRQRVHDGRAGDVGAGVVRLHQQAAGDTDAGR